MRRTVLYTSLALRFVVRAMSTSSKRAAIAQLTATNNKYSNLINVAHCAALAKKQGACMLFLPECFGFIGSSSAETIRNAEVLEDGGNEGTPTKYNTPEVSSVLESTVNGDGKIAPEDQQNSEEAKNNDAISLMHGLKTIAQASNLWISGGGIHEVVADQENRVYNTHVILNNEGALMQKYRKIHLFDVSIPSRGVELKESNTTLAGNSIEVCPSPLGMLGLSTCYDMRFPEQYTELVKRGAQIMLAPSAFTVPTGTAHWHVLLRARAIETQCYVLAAAQVGRHNVKRESYGHALAVDPWGTVMADAELNEGPTVVLCDIDVEDQLADVRLRMPIQQHRATAEETMNESE